MTSDTRDAKIRFKKTNLKSRYGDVTVKQGVILMDALLELGLPVASSCGGDGVCTKCRLHVLPLEEKACSPISEFERGLLNRISAEPNERISCQTEVLGSIEVDADYW